MINYETYCRIVHLYRRERFTAARIARILGLDERTVLHWIEQGTYEARKGSRRASKLDPFKAHIIRLVQSYPYTGMQILQRLREEGYAGGKSILNEYLSKIRPRKPKAFLTLSFAPGECAQVDWGHYGTITVGSIQRKLSFFLMVLCYSRMMYLEFTLSQSMEHFLGCHQNAFEYFGRVPHDIMVDNLKSAVLKRLVGQDPVFNPRYLDFSRHYGFQIKPCAVGKGNEKGRVENAVGYVKKNFLAGLHRTDFSAINPAARHWLDNVANIRIHGATHKKPVELFRAEEPALLPLPCMPYEVASIRQVRATNRFRVLFESNRYSVPAEYASERLTLKAYPDRICLYHKNQLVAQHPRSYDRNRDFEHPDHPRELLQQRRKARDQRLLMDFLKLSSQAEFYYEQLTQRRLNSRHHIRQIVALSEIYGPHKVSRAIRDAIHFQAFSCEYIANILEQRERIRPEPGALHLTRGEDLLELDTPEPNLSIYDPEDSSQNPHTDPFP